MKKIFIILIGLSTNFIIHSMCHGQRPMPDFKTHDIGEVWSLVSNFGNYGDPNTSFPSYNWPGGSVNYYLWEGRFWVGAVIQGDTLVSQADFGFYEWSPSDSSTFFEGSGRSEWDLACEYDDWDPGTNFRPLGIKVSQRALAWSSSDYDDFIAYEYLITYDKSQAFYPEDTLQNVIVSWIFDADVSGYDLTAPHIDDLVSFDGWTDGEWTTAYRPHRETTDVYPYDEVTLLPDTTLEIPDGVLDQMTVFGDEPEEKTLHGDTLYIWRNISYVYDGDNPAEPGDDEGEYGLAIGYIGGIVLYAPPSPTDSVWIDSYGDTARQIRPYAHQWWNWNNVPGSDAQRYRYMTATDSSSTGYHFKPHPFDLGAPTFDYTYLLSYGPYEIADGETLCFVFSGVMGSSLNGGVVDSLRPNEWLLGLRRNADNALRYYYLGSQISDPLHPSGPYEDIHWGVSPTGVEEERNNEQFKLQNVKLYQNHPNPFNMHTVISYQLSAPSHATLQVYDIAGRLVETLVNENQEPGVYRLQWDGEDSSGKKVASGIYFYRLNAGSLNLTKKMIILR
jgi:hypothetical protein